MLVISQALACTTGSNVLVEEADCEAKAGSSTQSQEQAKNDGPSNSGDFSTILGDFEA